MIVCGIDEAGRGSVIGPMVVAGVSIDEGKIGILSDLGVKDSKSLSRNKRFALYEKIKQVADGVLEIILDPSEIDFYLKRKGGPGINILEAKVATEIIRSLKPNVVYIDSPDVNTERYLSIVLRMLVEDLKPKIFCEHRADVRYPIVSAASIVAKVRRDLEIKKLCDTYGNLGSGYSSDRRTLDFLKDYVLSNRELPSFVRKGWRTLNKVLQTNLDLYSK